MTEKETKKERVNVGRPRTYEEDTDVYSERVPISHIPIVKEMVLAYLKPFRLDNN